MRDISTMQSKSTYIASTDIFSSRFLLSSSSSLFTSRSYVHIFTVAHLTLFSVNFKVNYLVGNALLLANPEQLLLAAISLAGMKLVPRICNTTARRRPAVAVLNTLIIGPVDVPFVRSCVSRTRGISQALLDIPREVLLTALLERGSEVMILIVEHVIRSFPILDARMGGGSRPIGVEFAIGQYRRRSSAGVVIPIIKTLTAFLLCVEQEHVVVVQHV